MRSADEERRGSRHQLRHDLTEAERRSWFRLRDRRLADFKFVRRESVGRYVADFYCREAKLLVELDGSQHADKPYDTVRDTWLASQGYRVLRFWNAEAMTNTIGVLDTILAALPPSPRTRGGGRDDLVVGATSGSEGEGAYPPEPHPVPPPHPRLPPRFGDDEVAEALSPRAGRGGDPG